MLPLDSSRRLDQPKVSRSRRANSSPDRVGRLSERAARFLGTGLYLFLQTMVVLAWIGFNVVAIRWEIDPYPFILLNLIFSAQAAYAAPLILLAQNRQDDRDRIALGQDRLQAKETQADTEYLARELAALKIAIGEATTRHYLRGELSKVAKLLPDSQPARRPPKPRGARATQPEAPDLDGQGPAQA
jgi:uncharacterized membrane protein